MDGHGRVGAVSGRRIPRRAELHAGDVRRLVGYQPGDRVGDVLRLEDLDRQGALHLADGVLAAAAAWAISASMAGFCDMPVATPVG